MRQSTSSDPNSDATQGGVMADRLNWLRAGVMGANDGIVSTAGMVLGVAGAAVGEKALLASGIAAVAAGALSMAVGEYVSVSSQRDSQRAEIEHEKAEIEHDPESELSELTSLIAAQGIDRRLAQQVAEQLSQRDALAAHARLELGINPKDLSNPWHAGVASMVAFVVGGLIPLAVILVAKRSIAVPVTVTAVVLALALTGYVAARLGHAPAERASARTVGGGILAMAITYGIGSMVGRL